MLTKHTVIVKELYGQSTKFDKIKHSKISFKLFLLILWIFVKRWKKKKFNWKEIGFEMVRQCFRFTKIIAIYWKFFFYLCKLKNHLNSDLFYAQINKFTWRLQNARFSIQTTLARIKPHNARRKSSIAIFFCPFNKLICSTTIRLLRLEYLSAQ